MARWMLVAIVLGGCAAEPTGVGGELHSFVISREVIAGTTADAMDAGIDVDGDGVLDNQLGTGLAVVAQRGWLPVQALSDREVSAGDVLVVGQLQARDLDSTDGAGFALYRGVDPRPAPCDDQGCGHHLDGHGRFAIDPAIAPDPALVGYIRDGVMRTGSGRIMIEVGMFGVPIRLELIGAQVKLHVANGIHGSIAGAISTDEVTAKILPAFQQAISATVARDCTQLASPPACGCAPMSAGADLIGVFDHPPGGGAGDCRITVQEIADNVAVRSVIAPDVTIDGKRLLSFGLAIDTVDAELDP